MSYNIYILSQKPSPQDAHHDPSSRTHTTIFIETHESSPGSGRILQVTGSISEGAGMTFSETLTPNPSDSETYLSKQYLGQILADQYSNVVQLIESIPPPALQHTFSKKLMSYIPCKPDKTPYLPNEPVPADMKCSEWTLQRAVPALRSSGLLYPDGVPRDVPAILVTSPTWPPEVPPAKDYEIQVWKATAWKWDQERQKYWFFDHATRRKVWQA